jgi:quercetin dioxygenase-like cupin family protein
MEGEGRKMNRRELLGLLAALTAGEALATTAADPVKLDPRSYRVMFENDKLRVIEYRSKPGLGVCGQGRHSHPEHLTIALSGGKVKVRAENGSPRTLEAKPGSMFWAPAEVHEVENISGRDMHAYMVEYKNASWKPSTG